MLTLYKSPQHLFEQEFRLPTDVLPSVDGRLVTNCVFLVFHIHFGAVAEEIGSILVPITLVFQGGEPVRQLIRNREADLQAQEPVQEYTHTYANGDIYRVRACARMLWYMVIGLSCICIIHIEFYGCLYHRLT